MSTQDSADDDLPYVGESMLPLPDGFGHLLLRWMSCPECGSFDSLDYQGYEEFPDPDSDDVRLHVHRISCEDCGHKDEGYAPAFEADG